MIKATIRFYDEDTNIGIGNEFNPFLGKSYLDWDNPNHPIRWKAYGVCREFEVREVLKACKLFGRFVHINTGTHGDCFGATIFTNIKFTKNLEYLK